MKYEVQVTRIGYSAITFGIEAESEEQAKELAMERAYNTGWQEDMKVFEIDDVTETALTDEEWAEEYGN